MHMQMIEFNEAIFHGLAFFRTALTCSGSLSPEEGGMPLLDAVGVNCKNRATTVN